MHCPLRLPSLSFPSPGNVFGDQKTMKERIREQKRMVERSVRGLERDRANLGRDEKKLILEIKVRWEGRGSAGRSGDGC